MEKKSNDTLGSGQRPPRIQSGDPSDRKDRAGSAFSRVSLGSEPDNAENKHIKKLSRWVADQVFQERFEKANSKTSLEIEKFEKKFERLDSILENQKTAMANLNDLAIMAEQSKSRAGGFLQFVSEYVLNDVTFKTKLMD